MKPVYVVAKLAAVVGAICVLWQHGFVFDATPAGIEDKGSAGLALGAIGSLFENNATANKIIGFITQFFGLPAEPVAPAPVDPNAPKV